MLQSEIISSQTFSWFPQQGDVADALPFILIIVTIAVRARACWRAARPVASAQVHRLRGPATRHARTPFCLVAGAVLLFASRDVRNAFIASMTFTCVALSLVVLTGYVGQVSLAQMTFAGVGGFMLGHISHGWGIGFPFSLIIAGCARSPSDSSSGCPRFDFAA